MGTKKSVLTSQQLFNHISKPPIERSQFDMSHGLKTTLDAGKLIPIFIGEALPGDTFNMRTTCFGRLSTPLKPIMDNMFIDVHWFSIPERLIWSNWKKFMGEQKNPSDSINFLMPTMTSTAVTGYGEQSIYDYMALPTKVPGVVHRADFLRAYALTWNEWYRDENLQNSTYCPTDDGPDDPAQYSLLPRGKRKDYFTGALPFAQKGTAVSIPLGSSAPLTGTPNFSTFNTETNNQRPTWQGTNTSNNPMKWTTGTNTLQIVTAVGGTPSDPKFGDQTGSQVTGSVINAAWNAGTLTADLSSATASTINALRQAFQTQKFLERDARGGTRYTEIVRSHFSVISPDARQQRPEYLGGGSFPININPIAQTNGSGASGTTTPQGNLAAMGTLSVHCAGFVKSFTEHEIVLGLVSIRADLNYQQGLPKMWSRSTRFDFYWPTFAHLGEQAILNKEIYAQGSANPTQDAAAFGYQERYAEYRYQPSRITGKFRSNTTGTLDYWHLAQNFASLPALNSSFIVETPPISRVVAVPSEPNFLLDVFFKFKAARPMPTFSIPGMIDHF